MQHGTGSQGSMAMDLHLEAVTLKIRDKRRNPLKRQRKIEEDEHKHDSHSHSCSPRLSGAHLREGSAGKYRYLNDVKSIRLYHGLEMYNSPRRA